MTAVATTAPLSTPTAPQRRRIRRVVLCALAGLLGAYAVGTLLDPSDVPRFSFLPRPTQKYVCEVGDDWSPGWMGDDWERHGLFWDGPCNLAY